MEEIKLSSLNLNGVKYRLGKPIYDELGISYERFLEIFNRDAYTPVLSAAPDSNTLTYIDTDESERSFRVGQICTYRDHSIPGGYSIAILKAITVNGAVWEDMRDEMQRLEDVELLSMQAYSNAQLSLEISDEAKNVAEAARNAITTLEGLTNSDGVQEILASQTIKIAQNTEDITQLKETLANNILSIEMTEDGDINVLAGEGNTMFHDGYIDDSGDVILELIY